MYNLESSDGLGFMQEKTIMLSKQTLRYQSIKFFIDLQTFMGFFLALHSCH